MNYAEVYGRMHERGKYFAGYSIVPHVPAITELVDKHDPDSLLDYGCGRGMQYLALRVHEDWGGLLPTCYDIGVSGLGEKPEGQFGGVICTDVLEHIEESDLPALLDELFEYVQPGGFLFLGISTREAQKTLPDGRNAHLTVMPPHHWAQLIQGHQNPMVKVVLVFDADRDAPPLRLESQ